MTMQDIQKAVQLLKAGGLVAFPTETVYGLGADARNPQAVKRIFSAKERPYDHPLIVHIADSTQLNDWAREIPQAAYRLAQAFWPGPLTLILKKQTHVLDEVTGSQDTVGLRIPRHPIAQQLLSAFGDGVVAPSANKFTHISPTSAAHVEQELGASVDLILDGGDCEVGLESTIIDMSGNRPIILRPGMITAESIAQVLKEDVGFKQGETLSVRAPGMHHLHYAPETKTVLMQTQELSRFVTTLIPQDGQVALLMHSSTVLPHKQNVHIKKMPQEAAAYAHDLYHQLRLLDNQHFTRIVVEAVPSSAEWEAIRDRLTKASSK